MPESSDACVFCAIRDGATPGEIAYEDEHTLALLDLRPVFFGHTLVVPRRHIDDVFAVPDDLVSPYYQAVHRVAAGVKEAMESQGVFLCSNNRVSQSVFHLHTHVVPRTKGDGLRGFLWPRHKYPEGEMALVAERIRTALHQA